MSIIKQREHAGVARVLCIAAILLSIALAACASVGGLHKDAEAIDAQQLGIWQCMSAAMFSAAAWPRQRWWSAFGDRQLDALMAVALQGQPSLRVAEAPGPSGRGGERHCPCLAVSADRRGPDDHPPAVQRTRHGAAALAGHWKLINQALLGASYEIDFWGKNRAAVATGVAAAPWLAALAVLHET